MRLHLLFAAVLAAALGCGAAPSDPELVAEFRAHRAQYDTLLAMFRADSGLGRVGDGFTRPADFFSGSSQPDSPPVTAERLARYRRLFDRLSLPDGIEGYDKKRVIYFWRWGSGGGAGLGGQGKGLAFSDSLPPDRPAAFGCERPRVSCWRFRPIDGGWFILEERHN